MWLPEKNPEINPVQFICKWVQNITKGSVWLISVKSLVLINGEEPKYSRLFPRTLKEIMRENGKINTLELLTLGNASGLAGKIYE